MKITDDSLKLSLAYHKIDTFHGEWDTKEGPGKSMKNVLYVFGVPKDTSRDEETLNSKKSSP